MLGWFKAGIVSKAIVYDMEGLYCWYFEFMGEFGEDFKMLIC